MRALPKGSIHLCSLYPALSVSNSTHLIGYFSIFRPTYLLPPHLRLAIKSCSQSKIQKHQHTLNNWPYFPQRHLHFNRGKHVAPKISGNSQRNTWCISKIGGCDLGDLITDLLPARVPSKAGILVLNSSKCGQDRAQGDMLSGWKLH